MPVAAALPAITGLMGGAGGLLSSLGAGNNAAEWRQNAGVDYLNNMGKGVAQSLQTMYDPYADTIRNAGATGLNQWGQVAYPWGDALFQNGEANAKGMQQLFQDSGMSYNPNDQSQWYTNQNANLGNDMDHFRNVANSNFERGDNGTFSALENFLSPYMMGQGANQQSLANSANGILQSGGQNPFSDALMNTGNKLTQKDPYIEAGQQRGLDLINREALLSPEQAANYGGELAQRGIQQNAEKVYRDANNRGGGPGSVVASGTGNQMKADFADDAARANADARMQALMSQQGLNLQQMGQGANLLNAGNQTDTSRMGVGASAYGSGGGLANQQLGIGSGMMNDLLQNQLGFTNQYGQTANNAANWQLGMGGLANQMAGTQGQLFNQGFNQNLQNAGMNLDYINGGVNRASQMANAMNGAQGQWTGAYNANMNPYTTIMGQFGDLARTGANFAGGYLNNMNSAMNMLMNPGNQQQDTNWGGIASGAGGILNSIPGLGGKKG